MSKFDTYARRFPRAAMERRQGILQVTLSTDGGPFRWDLEAQRQLVEATAEIAADCENRVVILTGTGLEFAGPRADPEVSVYAKSGIEVTPAALQRTHGNARRLIANMLAIEVPMIAAVNGPARRHSELALMCDIVLASETATFEDTAHFAIGGHVPGDGLNTVLTLLMGLNRARYFMLTGQVISAVEAKDMGLVAEVLSPQELLPRAWAIAEQMAGKPDLLLRHTRQVLTHPLKKALDDSLAYHLSVEALAAVQTHGRLGLA